MLAWAAEAQCHGAQRAAHLVPALLRVNLLCTKIGRRYVKYYNCHSDAVFADNARTRSWDRARREPGSEGERLMPEGPLHPVMGPGDACNHRASLDRGFTSRALPSNYIPMEWYDDSN